MRIVELRRLKVANAALKCDGCGVQFRERETFWVIRKQPVGTINVCLCRECGYQLSQAEQENTE